MELIAYRSELQLSHCDWLVARGGMLVYWTKQANVLAKKIWNMLKNFLSGSAQSSLYKNYPDSRANLGQILQILHPLGDFRGSCGPVGAKRPMAGFWWPLRKDAPE